MIENEDMKNKINSLIVDLDEAGVGVVGHIQFMYSLWCMDNDADEVPHELLFRLGVEAHNAELIAICSLRTSVVIEESGIVDAINRLTNSVERLGLNGAQSTFGAVELLAHELKKFHEKFDFGE